MRGSGEFGMLIDNFSFFFFFLAHGELYAIVRVKLRNDDQSHFRRVQIYGVGNTCSNIRR